MDNKKAPTDIAPESFTDCLNVDFSTPYRVENRLGFAKFNSAAISGTAAVMSLHRYVAPTTTDLLAYMADGTIRRSVDAAGTWADSKSGLNTNAVGVTVQFGGRRVSSTQYAGRLFFVNGVNAPLTFSSTDGWQNMGLIAPSVAPTLSAMYGQGSAAMASGNYYFKFTFYASAKGLESNPSQATTVLALTASAAGVGMVLPATADSQATHKRIYRTTNSGGTYNLLAEVLASALSFTATAADAELGDVVETDNNPPPVFKYLEEYQACLFGAGDPTDTVTKSLLYYSKQLDDSPEAWPTSYYLSITPDDGDEITLVRKVGDRLVVAKNNSWGVVLGDSPSNFRYVQLDPSRGCIAPWTAWLTDYGLIWLSSDGFRTCNGYQSELICKDTLDIAALGLNYAQLVKFRGVYFKGKKQYICGILTGSNTSIDKAIKIQFPGQEWSFDVYPGLVTYSQFFDGDMNEHIYAGSGAAGFVHEMFGASVHTDDTASIGYHFTFGPAYMGSFERTKKFQTVVIDADNSSAPAVGFQYSVDGGTMSDVSNLSCTGRYTKKGLNKTGKYTQLKCSGTANTYHRFNDFEIRAGVEKLGRF
jgi:hypothetical protein